MRLTLPQNQSIVEIEKLETTSMTMMVRIERIEMAELLMMPIFQELAV
jgi:hypothetical protein